MANEENLIPYRFNKRSANEARENGSKGGKKSGEVRRKRKARKEQMEMLLTLPVKNQEKVFEYQGLYYINEKEIDNQMALIVAMYAKALKGDVQAFNAIREVTQDDKNVSQEDRVQIINDLPNEEDEEDDKS